MESKDQTKKDGSTMSRNRACAPLTAWEIEARQTLRAELYRKEVKFKNLARRLETLGIEESAAQLSRKINRGKFSAAFFFACLEALGVRDLRLPEPVSAMPRSDPSSQAPT